MNSALSMGAHAAWHCARAFMLMLAVLMTGCASFYVDTATRDVPASELKPVAQAAPVQLLFEFQTKGVQNSRATDHLRSQVFDQVKASGLFSAVEDKPVANGAILSLKLNNVPLSDDAFGKGFVTGLTFGLAGNQVTDGYVCTIEYLAPNQKAPIVKTARHAIHTVMGAKEAPANGVRAETIEEAVRTMTRQIVGTSLKDLSFDPDFR